MRHGLRRRSGQIRTEPEEISVLATVEAEEGHFVLTDTTTNQEYFVPNTRENRRFQPTLSSLCDGKPKRFRLAVVLSSKQMVGCLVGSKSDFLTSVIIKSISRH